MQTLHSLRRDLPNISSDTTSGPPFRDPPVLLNRSRQPTFSRNRHSQTIPFRSKSRQWSRSRISQYIQTLEEPPSKRSDLALDGSLYLPKSNDRNFYGRFITLGYHHTAGPLNDPLRTRSERNKTFELWKRVKPNGWKFKVDANSGLRATTVLDSSTRERLRALSLNTPVQERSSSIRVTNLIDRIDLSNIH